MGDRRTGAAGGQPESRRAPPEAPAGWREVAAELLGDFRVSRLPMTLGIGLVSGVILVTLTISLAALVFRGELSQHLPTGVGMALYGTLTIGIISVVGSGLDGVVAGVQDNTAAVIGAAAAAIASGVASDVALPSVIAFIAVSSVVTAIALGGIGYFKLGALIRYVPYPVVGGFLVATGFLILDGARAILFESPDGSPVMSLEEMVRWLPGLVLGLAVVVLARNRRGRLAVPWLIAATIVGFHLGIAVAGVDRATAIEQGWLLGGFEGQALWQPDVLRTIGDADWGTVFGQAGALVTVIALAVISLMIKVHAMDQATGVDIDVDRELTVAGLSTALAVPGGGMPGYMHYAQTLLMRKLAGPRRGPALVAVLLSGIVLTMGSSVLSVVPTALVGGLLVYLGTNFLVTWLWDTRNRLGAADYALVAGAGVSVVVFGFLPAIALGTIVAIVLFVVRYSRVDAIRHSYTLEVFRSSIERSPEQDRALEEVGHRVVVLEVHGFLFFGTAHRVFEDPRLHPETKDLEYVIFDMARVTGVDSSTSLALAKLARRGRASGFAVLVAGLPDSGAEINSELAGDELPVREFHTLDDAVEWCEERLLEELPAATARNHDLSVLLTDILDSEDAATLVCSEFERVELEPETVVIEQGVATPGLFYVESGSLTARLGMANGETVRLRTMQPGTLIGEISLYLGGRTTAEVVADGPATVLHLSDESLTRIESEDPATAAAIHRLAARTLAGRVLHAERALRTLRE